MLHVMIRVVKNIISGNASYVIFGVVTGSCVGVVFTRLRNVSPDCDAGGRSLDSHAEGLRRLRV
jgi:hypothetical protein